MFRHKWGIHLPNGPMDLGTHIDTIGDGCYTLLHDQANVLPELRRRCPNALILVRCYTPDWYAENPEDWARRCATIFRSIKSYTTHITWANEQNLRAESGGVVGAPGITREHYETIAEWNERFIAEFKHQPGTEGAILHYPAFATGHSDDQDDYGYVGLDICRNGINQCQVLDRHYYPDIQVNVMDEWRGAERVVLTSGLFPTKPIFISECGNFRVTDPSTPSHYQAMGYHWQGLSNILGWTWFIAEDPTKHHAENDMSRNPKIAEALKSATKIDIGTEFDFATGDIMQVGMKPPPPPPPVPPQPAQPVWNISPTLDILWAAATQLEDHNYPWAGQGIKSMIALLKGEK